MLNQTTIRAASVDEAIEQGLRQLGITRDEAEIHVINPGKKGFLGFGQQDAIVEVRGTETISLNELTDASELETETTQATESVANEPIENIEITPPVIEIDEAPVVEEVPPVAHDEQPVEETIADELDTEAVQSDDIPTDVDETDETDLEQDQDEVTPVSENLYPYAEQVGDYIVAILHEYGADATVDCEIDGRDVFIDIDTEKSGLVIGKHGKIINSLQILAQTYLLSLCRRHMNVILNVGDYRKRRKTVLENMAQDALDEVLATQQSVSMPVLPAYERKQIHKYLANKPGIKTYSQGREPHRHLVVDYVS